jgi:acetylornithine/succinyldiaminopimelate/putrescine aminotransferase
MKYNVALAFEFCGLFSNLKLFDILLLKGFGGGMPLGAFVADKNYGLSHNNGAWAIYFGGHPVCCAAGF